MFCFNAICDNFIQVSQTFCRFEFKHEVEKVCFISVEPQQGREGITFTFRVFKMCMSHIFAGHDLLWTTLGYVESYWLRAQSFKHLTQ